MGSGVPTHQACVALRVLRAQEMMQHLLYTFNIALLMKEECHTTAKLQGRSTYASCLDGSGHMICRTCRTRVYVLLRHDDAHALKVLLDESSSFY